MPHLILTAGILHLALSAGSLAIPRMLQWKEALSSLAPLYRQMFWTYAGYILGINLSFGLISIYGKEALLDGSFLARSITLLIALYWAVRVFIQFMYFDTRMVPKEWIYKTGETALLFCFIVLAIVYSLAFYFNLS